MAPTGMGAGGQESFAGQKTCVGVDQSGYMYIYSVSCGVSGAARGGRASEKARLRARERGLMEWLLTERIYVPLQCVLGDVGGGERGEGE